MEASVGRRIFWGVAIAIAASFLIMAWQAFPLGETDTLWFPPAAVQFHRGEGLINSLHEKVNLYDPAKQHRFLFYTPGFPILLSYLLIEPTGRGAMFGVALISALALLLSAAVIDRLMQKTEMCWGASQAVLGSLGLLALATFIGSYRVGRPDYPAVMILMGMVWLELKLASGRREWASGLFLGLMAYVHPVAALFTGGCLGALYAWRCRGAELILRLVMIGLMGISVFFAAMMLSPYGWSANWEGLKAHAAGTLVEGTSYPIFKYWVIHTYASGYGFLFVLAMILAGKTYREHQTRCATPWIFGTAVLFFGLLLQHFVAEAWDRSYNLWIFSPLMVLVVLFSREVRESSVWRWVSGVILLGCSIGYLHTLGLYGAYLQNGLSYTEARAKFKELLDQHAGRVAVSKSLWVLGDDYRRLVGFGLKPEHLAEKPPFLALQQRYTTYSQSPKIPGYELIYDGFEAKPTRFLGVFLSPSPPGYQFSFYRRRE